MKMIIRRNSWSLRIYPISYGRNLLIFWYWLILWTFWKIINWVNFQIFTTSTYIWFFAVFLKIAVSIMAVTTYFFIIFFLKKWQFRIRNQIFKISRNSEHVSRIFTKMAIPMMKFQFRRKKWNYRLKLLKSGNSRKSA